MTTIVQNELDEVIESEWDYLMSKVDEWSLLHGEQDMEVLEHILRCILHLDQTLLEPCSNLAETLLRPSSNLDRKRVV